MLELTSQVKLKIITVFAFFVATICFAGVVKWRFSQVSKSLVITKPNSQLQDVSKEIEKSRQELGGLFEKLNIEIQKMKETNTNLPVTNQNQ